jgi:hypothetical protein
MTSKCTRADHLRIVLLTFKAASRAIAYDCKPIDQVGNDTTKVFP